MVGERPCCSVLRVDRASQRFFGAASRPGNSAEAVMSEKLRTGVSGYEWRWWHNVLGLAIVLAIVVLMSW